MKDVDAARTERLASAWRHYRNAVALGKEDVARAAYARFLDLEAADADATVQAATQACVGDARADGTLVNSKRDFDRTYGPNVRKQLKVLRDIDAGYFDQPLPAQKEWVASVLRDGWEPGGV